MTYSFLYYDQISLIEIGIAKTEDPDCKHNTNWVATRSKLWLEEGSKSCNTRFMMVFLSF